MAAPAPARIKEPEVVKEESPFARLIAQAHADVQEWRAKNGLAPYDFDAVNDKARKRRSPEEINLRLMGLNRMKAKKASAR
jgi:hypothetical protein